MSALSVSPKANLCLPNELAGKEQKSPVGKEEITHGTPEVVSTLSQLRPPVTTQNAGKIDFMSVFFFPLFLVMPISTIITVG